MGYVKNITKTSTTIRQADSNGKRIVGKVEEVTRKEKTNSLEIAPNKASPS